MQVQEFQIHELSITPINIYLYVPPITWKGDCVGHIGNHDTFFWVLDGECFLNIDSQYSLIKPGQLAYLPKGKLRAYTHVSSNFCMYEMAFSAGINGEDLMEALHLRDSHYVVDIAEKEEMSHLFETSYHKELFKNPIYDLAWSANIINIIKLYTKARQKQDEINTPIISPILDYMTANLQHPITTEELSSLVHMQPNYFIRRFKAACGLPPIAYLGRLRIYKAMELLVSTTESIEQIAHAVGFTDTSYFSRFFRKNCGVTPSEYRSAFRR